MAFERECFKIRIRSNHPAYEEIASYLDAARRDPQSRLKIVRDFQYARKAGYERLIVIYSHPLFSGGLRDLLRRTVRYEDQWSVQTNLSPPRPDMGPVLDNPT